MTFQTPRIVVTGLAVAGLIFAPGCKRNAEPEAAPETAASPSPTRGPSKPSAIVEPPNGDPAVSEPTPVSVREVYVVTAFQAMSELGTHDFPVGTKVTLVGEEEGDYLIEYQGVSVRNAREFFSETPVESAPPTPEPAASDTIPVEPAPTPEPAIAPLGYPDSTAPAPASTPAPEAPSALTVTAEEEVVVVDTPPTAEDRKNAELLEAIRTLNEEIRVEQEAAATASAPNSSKVEKLKKRRDQLSEDLTRSAKP